MHTPLTRSTTLRGLLTAAVALAALATLALTSPSPASASTKQVSILQDNSFLTSPATALPVARALGARTVRVTVQWYQMAPDPKSTYEPKFSASNPNAYAAAKWAPYDALVQQAQQDGLTVALQVTGGAPRWAEGKDAPAAYRTNTDYAWRPNAKLYGEFVHAVAERYDGTFTPTGSKTALPAVRFWSFWNEPNNGEQLGPQTTNRSTVPVAPNYYRALLNAAWKTMDQIPGHGRDTLLVGELDPLGNALRAAGHPGSQPGTTGATAALSFLRALYCVGSNSRPLTGTAAKLYSCPTTAAASRKFRSQNPALFKATGFAVHPYSFASPPDANPSKINADYGTFPVLGRFETAIDRVTAAYGSHERFPIYNDEFGYITSPPEPSHDGYPSPATAATYLNQAEYISYKNPRIATYDQYLLDDPPVIAGRPAPGFNTGLYTSVGKPKATLAAYELPVWLPKATVKAGASTEIWGGARPAAFSQSATTKAAPTVEIQMQKGGKGSWTTIQTVKVSTTTGYFDIHTKLPYSGNLRLTYTYPKTEPLLPVNVAGSMISGRTVKVKVTG